MEYRADDVAPSAKPAKAEPPPPPTLPISVSISGSFLVETIPKHILAHEIAKYLSPMDVARLGGTCQTLRRHGGLPRNPLRVKLYSVGTRSYLDHDLFVSEYETGRMVEYTSTTDICSKNEKEESQGKAMLYTDTDYVFWRYDTVRSQWTYLRRDVPLEGRTSSEELHAHDLSFLARKRTCHDGEDSGQKWRFQQSAIGATRTNDENVNEEGEQVAIPTESLCLHDLHLQVSGHKEVDSRLAKSKHIESLTVVGKSDWRAITKKKNQSSSETADASSSHYIYSDAELNHDTYVNQATESESRVSAIQAREMFRIIPSNKKQQQHEILEGKHPVYLPIRPKSVFHYDFGRRHFYSLQSLESGEDLAGVFSSVDSQLGVAIIPFEMWTTAYESAITRTAVSNPRSFSSDITTVSGDIREEQLRQHRFISFQAIGDGFLNSILEIPFLPNAKREGIGNEPLLELVYKLDDMYPILNYMAHAADKIAGNRVGDSHHHTDVANSLRNQGYSVCLLHAEEEGGYNNDETTTDQTGQLLPIVRILPPSTSARNGGDEANQHDDSSIILPIIPKDPSRSFRVVFL